MVREFSLVKRKTKALLTDGADRANATLQAQIPELSTRHGGSPVLIPKAPAGFWREAARLNSNKFLIPSDVL